MMTFTKLIVKFYVSKNVPPPQKVESEGSMVSLKIKNTLKLKLLETVFGEAYNVYTEALSKGHLF